MKHSKNRKKQWSKCVPGIDDEILKIKQLQEIDDASFSVTGKVKKTELKYSTAPRIKTDNKMRYVKSQVVDIWGPDCLKPELSKRRQAALAGMARYKKPVEIIHPGSSWFPEPKEHEKLLTLLADDEMVRERIRNKFVIKPSDYVDKNEGQVVPETEELEDEQAEQAEPKPPVEQKKPRAKTTKEKKRKLVNRLLEDERTRTRMREKGEAHGLRNIPKLCKEISAAKRAQQDKNAELKQMARAKKEDRVLKEQLLAVPFQLPSELADNLRSIEPEGDLVRELADRIKAHKFRSDKPRKHKRKMTRMVKKKGLV